MNIKQTALRILMLEDGQDDAGLIKRALEKGSILFEARIVDSREMFLQQLKDFSPDIILSDHSLPQFNSIEALQICRDEGFKIPFILVTGTVSDQFATQLLKMGASGYVLKSDLEKLPSFILSIINNQGLTEKNTRVRLAT
jgi:CheY-like chemotaxis protein